MRRRSDAALDASDANTPPRRDRATQANRRRGQTRLTGARPIETLEPRRLLSGGITPDPRYGEAPADGNDLAFDADGVLHRVWRDRHTHALRYATRLPDQSWTPTRTIDFRPVGGEMSMVIDPAGTPVIAYYDRLNGDLRVARLGPTGWTRTLVDATGDVGSFNSLLRHSSGRYFIAYYDRSSQDLKVANETAPGSNVWTTRTVDSLGDVGGYASIAEGGRKTVNVVYSDNLFGRLKMATLANGASAWTTTVIDTALPAGARHIDLVTAGGGVLLVAYQDPHHRRLKTAAQIDTSNWFRWELPPGDNGYFASVYFADSGNPRVLHTDRAGRTVDLAWFGESNGQQPRPVALAGDHLRVAIAPNGVQVFNRVDPETGLLRTTPTAPYRHAASMEAGDRIIHFETIGGSNDDVSIRRVGWSINTIGWQGYVDTRVQQLKSLGMRRILLHNPFGTLPTDPVFQFDQYVHAQEAGLTWLTEGFVEAWKPVTDSGIEVIAYIGMLRGDPDFTSLTDVKQYMDRVRRSVDVLVRAGISIGLDSIVGSAADSREFMVTELLRHSGVKIYNENRPPALFSHWHDYNGVYYDDGFLESAPTANPAYYWAAPDHMLTGEIIRYLGNPPPGYTYPSLGWRTPDAIRVLRDGHTVASDLVFLTRVGYTLPQFMSMALGTPAPHPGGENPVPQQPTPAFRPGNPLPEEGAGREATTREVLFGSVAIDPMPI